MLKRLYTVPIIIEKGKRGTPYKIDRKFYNNGEVVEIICKVVRGFEAIKDGNGKFDKVSDIDGKDIHASVKSARFTLCNEVLSDNFEDSIKIYFTRTASTSWIFGIYDDTDIFTEYTMNKAEFSDFLHEFCTFERKRVRCGKLTRKMREWLDSRA